MGLYDTFIDGDKSGQVKLWDDSFSEYTIGDRVPSYGSASTFSIAMREGGYVNIAENIFVSWTDESKFSPIVDKYGAPFLKQKTTGMMNEFWWL